MSDDYLNTVARLEPDITPIDLTAAAASIAISLKRIADLLEVTTTHDGQVITLPQVMLLLTQCFQLPGPSKTRMNLAEVLESIQQHGVGQGR